MFDAVRNNKRIVQVFLAMIMLPFAFFGVDSYLKGVGDSGDVAKVDGSPITQQQFQQSMRDQQERLRSMAGGKFDPAILNTPEARKAVLDDLINQRVLLIESTKRNLMASNDAIRQMIGQIDAFKVDGKFSKERYESLLASRGMSPAGFEAQIRQDIALKQLMGGVMQGALVSRLAADQIVALQTERREVQEVRLPFDNFMDKVKLESDAVKKYYETNAKLFELPEQARVEYVVLSQEALSGQAAVSESEIKTYYDNNQKRFQQQEERRASHILIVPENNDKAAAKAKAESVLAELQKAPASFADLAKKYSKDPGSAAKGGDLGFFGRGMMVKPFEDAAFALKEGETSGLVESDFGYHLIKVTQIRGNNVKPLADVRTEIEADLRKAAATRRYAEAAETFSNMVYEQADSLKPVAEKLGLTIKQSDWMTRQAKTVQGVLANEKLQTAIFSEDAIKSRRNTEAVEVANNTLVAARVVEHKPASLQPLEAVKSGIEQRLKREEAMRLAKQEGENRLVALSKGEDKQTWGAAKAVSRMNADKLTAQALEAVFRLKADKLPAYTGVNSPESGYVLYKLVKVEAGAAPEKSQRDLMQEQLTNMAAQEEARAYLASLRKRLKVEINEGALKSVDIR